MNGKLNVGLLILRGKNAKATILSRLLGLNTIKQLR